ncbi:acetyl esterase/lipase [Flavobacterium arsenatis]|uniref:Acetyl esterase/lipase n=1 Tax=Flavobacterium arsenatis TaxID=1484332 RepID=A0ABU1TNU9_9FLAO|nr:alpha/beta hydrolase [Flavobacterium arsenatis]MDR6967087.1 acetyl esterase/lipase [Flavobacterium arsenatis]
MKKVFIVAFLITFTLSIKAQETRYSTKTNLNYYSEKVNKSDAYINERCVLDIYYPENIKDFPTVIWFHGGGLTQGEKEIPQALTKKGIAVIGVNYRLSPKIKSPKYIEDAAAAVAWAFANIEKYGGSRSKIFVSGHSAGGYLAMMVGLDKKWLAKYNVDANGIAGLIPFSGQTITHFNIRQEKNIPETQPTIDEFAPLFHVRADAPPLLLITGDRELEMLGRYEENAYMMRMMKVVGHKETKLLELDGYNHGMTEPAFPLLLNEIKRIIEKR